MGETQINTSFKQQTLSLSAQSHTVLISFRSWQFKTDHILINCAWSKTKQQWILWDTGIAQLIVYANDGMHHSWSHMLWTVSPVDTVSHIRGQTHHTWVVWSVNSMRGNVHTCKQCEGRWSYVWTAQTWTRCRSWGLGLRSPIGFLPFINRSSKNGRKHRTGLIQS